MSAPTIAAPERPECCPRCFRRAVVREDGTIRPHVRPSSRVTPGGFVACVRVEAEKAGPVGGGPASPTGRRSA